eukprot:2852348-Pyramimonas_sp.AAC.1
MAARKGETAKLIQKPRGHRLPRTFLDVLVALLGLRGGTLCRLEAIFGRLGTILGRLRGILGRLGVLDCLRRP